MAVVFLGGFRFPLARNHEITIFRYSVLSIFRNPDIPKSRKKTKPEPRPPINTQ
jgi:hypothetical protein